MDQHATHLHAEVLRLIRLPDDQRLEGAESVASAWAELSAHSLELAAVCLPALRFPEKFRVWDDVGKVCGGCFMRWCRDFAAFRAGSAVGGNGAGIRAVWSTTAAGNPAEALTGVAMTQHLLNLWQPIPQETYSRIWMFAAAADPEWALWWYKYPKVPGWLRPSKLTPGDWLDVLNDEDEEERLNAIRVIGQLGSLHSNP